jgi:ketosteroid isomerase-like protein
VARNHDAFPQCYTKKWSSLIANFRLYLVRSMRLLALLLCACSLAIGEHSLSSEATRPSQTSDDEQTLWGLERAYWRYVEHNDLAAYSDLWHKDFLGWPSVSAAPVHKDHITDWITSQTAKGLAFKTVEFKPAAIQITGDVAFACYWVTFRWVDQEGSAAPHTFRITHAWLRSGKDWRIIGGMSMPESENPAK